MSKQYAIFHSQKGKGSGSGLGNHIDRSEGKEYSFSNADSSRSHLNVNVGLRNKIHLLPLQKSIDFRIREGYRGKTAIRKDAVKYISHILTGSNQKMKELESDPKKFKAWVQANIDFIKDEFGRDNIVRLAIHRDETTPHIHAVTVPITEDGRLSAKEMFGDRKTLQQRQDRYAELMKPFGLERGERNSKARHKDVKQFYSDVNELRIDFKAITDTLPKPTAKHLLNSKKWQEELETAVDNRFRNFIGSRQLNSTKALAQNKELRQEYQKLKDAYIKKQETVNALTSEKNKVLNEMERRETKSFNEGGRRVLSDINEHLKKKGNTKKFGYQNNELTVTEIIKRDNSNNKGMGM
jgi:hypothetical protein